MLIGTSTLDQSGPRNNSNEGIIHILQISRTRALSWIHCSIIPSTPLLSEVLFLSRRYSQHILSPTDWVKLFYIFIFLNYFIQYFLHTFKIGTQHYFLLSFPFVLYLSSLSGNSLWMSPVSKWFIALYFICTILHFTRSINFKTGDFTNN